MKKEIQDALNEQIARERAASRTYLTLAIWADLNSYDGAASFWYAQSEEEHQHMMRIVKFMVEADGVPVISDTDEPNPVVNSYQEMFTFGLEAEQSVTSSLNEKIDLALQMKDFKTFNFLQWFVTEQVEEENTMRTILDKLKLVEKHNGSILMFDKELGEIAAAKTAGEAE
ncbi:MAG: non-heme ferritin [Calditrichia bacterium]